MKSFILNLTVNVAKFVMGFLYFFIKLFPIQDKKIVMLSRQSNNINVDFTMLLEYIKKHNPEMKVTVLCRKIPKELIKRIGYCFYMIKCMYHIATSKVCIIDGYVIPISSLKQKKKLIVVQIWHAIGAIKQFGKQVVEKREGANANIAKIMKMHNNYSYIMCTSNKTKEIFAKAFGYDENKILTLGMPRIDYLLGKEDKLNQKVEKLLQEYPVLKEKKTILYVPTFRKGQSTHVQDVINATNTEKYNLIVKLHPLDETKIDSKYVVSSKYQTFELLKVSDYVITDYSAVAFEASILNKALFFYLYDVDDYQVNRGLNINLKEEMKSSTFSNIKEILNMIEQDKYNYKELEKFKNTYIETIDTENTKRIVEYVVKQMEE